MRYLFFVFVTAALVACSAKLAIPTQADAERGASKYTGYTLNEMNAGKTAFEANCGKCHGLKKPSSRNEEQWRQVVPRMVKKVNKSEIKIDEATQEKIIRYLTVAGQQ